MSYSEEVLEWQKALQKAGFDPGAIDGDFGPNTLAASLNSLGTMPGTVPPEELWTEIPPEWLPASSQMVRIIAHWTAGSYNVSSVDEEHYHFIWDGDGKVFRGDHSVTDNENCNDDDYAAHTKSLNTGSIGVSLACMSDAREEPFDAGDYPMTKGQWDGMCRGIAQLARTYGIAVSPTTVLSHAEVEGTLGVDQSGKWDYTRLPFAPELKGATACGNRLRADVAAVLAGGAVD